MTASKLAKIALVALALFAPGAAALAGCHPKDAPSPSPLPTSSVAIAAPDGSAPVRESSPLRALAVVELIAMSETFCARTEGGTVWCWGAGVNGELGSGSLDTTAVAVRVAGIEHATRLDAKNNRACVIADRRVSCWGESLVGSRSEPRPQLTPKPVGELAPPAETDVSDLAVSFPHVCMVHADQRVSCRALYGGLDARSVKNDGAGPATFIVADKDDVFRTAKADGIYSFRHSTIDSGSFQMGGMLEPGTRLVRPRPATDLRNEESRCVVRDGTVLCGPLDAPVAALRPIVFGATAAHVPNTLDLEHDALDARVVAARLRPAGPDLVLDLCIALPRHRYPWRVTNRRCFTFDRDKKTFTDVAAWPMPVAEAAWDRIKSPHPKEEAQLEPSPSGRTALARLGDGPSPGTQRLAFYDLVTGKELWTRTEKKHIDQWLTATDDFVIDVFTDEMGSDGLYSLVAISRAGARGAVYNIDTNGITHAEDEEILHRGYSQASLHHLALWTPDVTFLGANITRDVTGFRAPPKTATILYDETRRLVYAVADEPLGGVWIFDRAAKTTQFGGSPARSAR